MNKKIFGIKIGTILSAFACLCVALVIWMLVKYSLNAESALNLIGLSSFLRG